VVHSSPILPRLLLHLLGGNCSDVGRICPRLNRMANGPKWRCSCSSLPPPFPLVIDTNPIWRASRDLEFVFGFEWPLMRIGYLQFYLFMSYSRIGFILCMYICTSGGGFAINIYQLLHLFRPCNLVLFPMASHKSHQLLARHAPQTLLTSSGFTWFTSSPALQVQSSFSLLLWGV